MTDALLPPSDESNAATGDHALEHHSDALMCALPLRQVVQQGGWVSDPAAFCAAIRRLGGSRRHQPNARERMNTTSSTGDLIYRRLKESGHAA